MKIEIMYCPKNKELVRGHAPKITLLASGLVRVEATCPTHTREKLVKIREPETERPDEIGYTFPNLILPTVDLPGVPGTPDNPTTGFWEVYTKTIGQNLTGIEAQANYEHYAKELWDDLSTEDRQVLMDRFTKTGRVEPETPMEPPIDADAFFFHAQARKNPEKPVKRPSVSRTVKARYEAIEAEISEKRAFLASLRDDFVRLDPDAGWKVKLDYDALARIVGDSEYLKLVAEQTAMLDKYGDDLYL